MEMTFPWDNDSSNTHRKNRDFGTAFSVLSLHSPKFPFLNFLRLRLVHSALVLVGPLSLLLWTLYFIIVPLVQTDLWYITIWKMSVLREQFPKKGSSTPFPIVLEMGSQSLPRNNPSDHALFSWGERSWNAIYCKTHSLQATTVNDIPFITTQMRTENDIGKQWTHQKGRESH